jgi:GxxExxY protein
MGYGFLENVYENCLMIEFGKANLKADSQKKIKVFYKGKVVGGYQADIIVDDKIIVELKSVSHIQKTHEVQLVNYLMATKMPIGLLINFGPYGVKVKRKVRQFKEE